MSLAETVITAFVDRKLAQSGTPATRTEPVEHSLGKGILAGLIAGLAATAAKGVAEKLYPPHKEAEPMHWVAGAAIGAAYGGLAEYFPAASSRDGVNFGISLMALTHETTTPATGLAVASPNELRRERGSEITSHIIFGLVAETTRRIVRKML